MTRCSVRPALLALLAAGCTSTGDGFPVDARGWRTHLAHAGDVRLNGVACGDLDPSSPGDEIVACGADGSVVLVRRVPVPPDEDVPVGTFRFESEVILETAGELIQIAAGDVEPGRPGDEVVAVGVRLGGEDDGGRGVAWLLRRTAAGWEHEAILEDDALLHAVAIGELDPDVPGVEVALAGFTRRVHLWTPAPAGGAPAVRVVAELPGNAKGVALARGGLAVACDDGSLVLLRRGDEGAWVRAPGWREEAPLARVAARGAEVLACANDGVLRLYQADPEHAYSSVSRCVVLDDRLRGAVFADVYRGAPGDEVATAGYDGTVRVVTLRAWADPDPVVPPGAGIVQYATTSTIAARDTDRLHHLAAGELAGLGAVLVTAGYSGRVLVVQQVPADG